MTTRHGRMSCILFEQSLLASPMTDPTSRCVKPRRRPRSNCKSLRRSELCRLRSAETKTYPRPSLGCQLGSTIRRRRNAVPRMYLSSVMARLLPGHARPHGQPASYLYAFAHLRSAVDPVSMREAARKRHRVLLGLERIFTRPRPAGSGRNEVGLGTLSRHSRATCLKSHRHWSPP